MTLIEIRDATKSGDKDDGVEDASAGTMSGPRALEGPTGGIFGLEVVAARSGEGKARPLPFERFLAGVGCCASSTLRFAISKMEKTREMIGLNWFDVK